MSGAPWGRYWPLNVNICLNFEDRLGIIQVVHKAASKINVCHGVRYISKVWLKSLNFTICLGGPSTQS